jgi:hypothetical protein
MTISELVSKLAEGQSEQIANEIEVKIQMMLPDCVFGLLMNGLPIKNHNEKYVTKSSAHIAMQYGRDPNGKRVIKACADPQLFDINYPDCINATMTGREIMEMVLKANDVDGILICSAVSFDSYSIYKNAFKRLLTESATNSANHRKWWQVWK